MKDHNEINNNISQLVDKFKNGAERYQSDALLHNTINHLARGADPINIIDELITMNNELVKKNIELASKAPVAYVINKDMIQQH